MTNPYLHLLDEFNAAECGTSSGYGAHRRLGQQPCRACSKAAAEDAAMYKAERDDKPRPSKACTAEQVKALTEHRAQALLDFPDGFRSRKHTPKDAA